MRYLVSTLALIVLWPPFALAGDITLFGQGDMDTMYDWAVSAEKFEAQPKWSPSAGAPPLSIAKAVEIADAWIKKQNPEVRQFVVASVTLGHAEAWSSSPAERWFYRIDFQPVVSGRRLFGGQFTAVVLFDGSVVEPQAEKRVRSK